MQRPGGRSSSPRGVKIVWGLVAMEELAQSPRVACLPSRVRCRAVNLSPICMSEEGTVEAKLGCCLSTR